MLSDPWDWVYVVLVFVAFAVALYVFSQKPIE
jgi:hypothetical protein